MTPDKVDFEKIMAALIIARLKYQGRTRSWLAGRLGIDYGKVKRVLNGNERQQLSFTVAESMLNVLGTSVKEELIGYMIDDIRHDIEQAQTSIAAGLSSIDEGLKNLESGLAGINRAMEKLGKK